MAYRVDLTLGYLPALSKPCGKLCYFSHSYTGAAIAAFYLIRISTVPRVSLRYVRQRRTRRSILLLQSARFQSWYATTIQ